jgi:hypothetical protein
LLFSLATLVFLPSLLLARLLTGLAALLLTGLPTLLLTGLATLLIAILLHVRLLFESEV